MGVTRQNIRVTMVLEDLGRVPAYPLPAGHSVRLYRPGDEQLWLSIQSAADQYNAIRPELFARQFGLDPAPLTKRQFFLMAGPDTAIGTATAWFDNDFHGRPYGRIHWVAIIPEFQGRGLAKPLMSAVCRRLQELGHDRAYLTTSTARVAAIRLYRGDSAAWRELEQELKEDLGLGASGFS
jgi:ribosomal protein S18 acetylase RimI-like enzyme